MHLNTTEIPIGFGIVCSWSSIPFLIFFYKTLCLSLICFVLYIFSKIIASIYFNETIVTFMLPHDTGFMWGVLKPSIVARAYGPCTRRTLGLAHVAVEISQTDRQISLKISVVVNHRYSHYKSVWTFLDIADYERQPFITGRQNGVAANQNRISHTRPAIATIDLKLLKCHIIAAVGLVTQEARASKPWYLTIGWPEYSGPSTGRFNRFYYNYSVILMP